MAEDETFNKGDTGGEVLIERAGKFELLNANDMRAECGVDKEEKGDESTTVKEEDVTDQTADQVTGQKSAETVIEDLEVERKGDEQPAKVENGLKSEAATSTPVKSAQTSNGLIKRRTKSVDRARSKSAPGSKSDGANREAFEAWLVKKNEEIATQRKVGRAKQNFPTPEEIRRRKEDNEASYQAWLVKKKQQIEEERAKKRKELLSRPNIGHSRQECSEAFKAWLDTKKLHELEERKDREAKLKQQQEEASKVRPDLAKQAYRE